MNEGSEQNHSNLLCLFKFSSFFPFGYCVKEKLPFAFRFVFKQTLSYGNRLKEFLSFFHKEFKKQIREPNVLSEVRIT